MSLYMKVLITILLSFWLAINPARAQEVDAVTSGMVTDRQKADTLFSLANRNFRKARFDSAGYWLNKGIGFAQKTGNDELIFKYLMFQSNILFFREDYAEGLALLKKSYPYLARTSSYDLQRKYLLLSGRFYENLHRNDSAMYYYHECELLNNRQDPYQNWLVYYDIAQMFKRSEAFPESEKYFIKAYELTKPKGIRRDHVTVLVEFADLYHVLEKPEKFAPLMYEQEQMMAQVKGNILKDPAHTMYFFDWKKEPLEKKVLFMENVKRELDKAGHVGKAALANIYIAGFFEGVNQPDTALTYIRENQRVFEKQKDIISLYSNTSIAYRLLKKAGKLEDAIKEADKLFSLKDSIIRIQHRETLLDLETRYETEKKEKDITLLNYEKELGLTRLERETDLKEAFMRENLLKDSVVNRERDYNKLLGTENELKEHQLSNEQALREAAARENILKGNQLTKEKRIKWQLISGGLLILLFGFAIFFMYRKQRSKNVLIEKQSEDLQMLMKEIHHRVKNNLQVISSLLDLQSLTIKDRQASEAIKESRNRVYSMALIHQNLYKEENVIGIEMNDYINKLVQSLFQSYNSGGNKILLKTDIDHLLLDVDMVIPIGLVLNELISNSLKYAFHNTNSGSLHITFKKNEEGMLLKVQDNGAGFPQGMNVFQNSSFGYKLVKAFAQKLKAKLEVYNDNGACILLHIKKIKLA